jgi:hypothetical protein
MCSFDATFSSSVNSHSSILYVNRSSPVFGGLRDTGVKLGSVENTGMRPNGDDWPMVLMRSIPKPTGVVGSSRPAKQIRLHQLWSLDEHTSERV